jgi:hypothetical protein
MGTKRSKVPPAATADVHAVLPSDVAAKLGAFAGFHRRTKGDVIAAALAVYLRGFSVHVQRTTTEGRPAAPEGDRDASAA